MTLNENTTETENIISELREEGTGSRGTFYENYGSSIHPLLVPLAELLDATKHEHPELADRVAESIYHMR